MNAVTYPLAGPFIGQQPHRAPAECLALPLGREDAQLLALLVAKRVAVTHLQQRWRGRGRGRVSQRSGKVFHVL